MVGDKIEIPDPLNDPNFRGRRSLYLDDWATLVQPDMAKGENMVTHSVTYGSSALNASYLINGGALAALPTFLTLFTKTPPADIAWAASPFVAAILCTAVASTAAYLNFQFLAFMYWNDADQTAAMLRRFYEKSDAAPTDNRPSLEKKVRLSFRIGLVTALFALGFFLWGAGNFFLLATRAATA